MRKHLVSPFLTLGALATVSAAQAQPLGTFRWQQEPYCNVITLNVVQIGDVFQLDGFDDGCGAAVRGAVIGTAFQNPDGSIGMGMTVVTPGGRSLHLEARFGISTLSGAWRDGTGISGPWVFTPGPAHPGSPRPPLDATVVIEGAGVLVPSSLVAQLHPTGMTETVVTPRAGRLSINKSVSNASFTCSGNLVLLFITLDGVPIRNSVVSAPPGTPFSGVLTGVTLNPVAGGSHVLGIGMQCSPGGVLSGSVFALTISTVTVLP